MSWKVTLAEVSFGPAEQEAVRRVLDAGWVSMGPETSLFEAEFAEYLGASHAVAVSSGTAALHLALLAAGIQRGDEVIVPSLTFVATANAVRSVGAVPVFADVASLDDWTISVTQIEEKITPATTAIIVVHYGGFPCAMDAIGKVAERHGLAVVEDAAHAPGAVYNGRKLGTWGTVGCFSFFANKNMTTAEGGMVVTDDAQIASRLKLLRSHGMTSLTWDRHSGHSFSYDVLESGYNYRMDEIRATLGRVQLKKLECNNRKRKEKFGLLRHLLNNEPRVSYPFPDEVLPLSSCHIFPILLEHADVRARFMESMRLAEIQTSIHYPPVHLFTAYVSRERHTHGELPITEDIGSREVTLPMFADIRSEQIEMIASELSKSLRTITSNAAATRLAV
jgi:dTDP-4-amino-4,6-dideoxygalactose transaminase